MKEIVEENGVSLLSCPPFEKPSKDTNTSIMTDLISGPTVADCHPHGREILYAFIILGVGYNLVNMTRTGKL